MVVSTIKGVSGKRMRVGHVAGAILIVSRTRSVARSRFTLIRTLVHGGRSLGIITMNSSSRGVCDFHHSGSQCVEGLISRCNTHARSLLIGFQDGGYLIRFTGHF